MSESLISFDEPSGADFGDSPLHDFWGVGAGYEIKTGTSAKGYGWKRVYLRAIDVDVLKADDVYPFPTAEISIFYNDPAKTPKRREGQGINDWEAFSESLRAIFGDRVNSSLDEVFGGQVAGEGTMPSNPGKRFRMKRIPTLIRVAPDASSDNPEWQTKWHDELKPTWKMVEVEGVGSIAIEGESGGASGGASNEMQYVCGLADGLSEEKFYEVALEDPKVMQNPGLVTLLTNRSFVQEAVTLGLLTQDADGTLHKA